MMVARLLQRLCGLLLALGIAVAPATVTAQDMDSEELAELERMLTHLGFFPGPVDGVIDDKSRTAIRSYQDFAALPADGEPSASLLAELRDVVQLMAELNTAPPEPEPPRGPDTGLSPDDPPVADVSSEVPEASVAPTELPETADVTIAENSSAEPLETEPLATEPPVAEPAPHDVAESIDLDQPATTDGAPESSDEDGIEAQAAPDPTQTVAESPPPASRALLIEAPPPKPSVLPATAETEAIRPVSKPPSVPRKPARASAEPSVPSATKPAVDPPLAEAGSSTATSQEPSSSPAPAGTLLEQIVAAIDNPPTRASQPAATAPVTTSEAPEPHGPAPSAAPALAAAASPEPAPTPEPASAPEPTQAPEPAPAPAPSLAPAPTPGADPYQAALAPYAPLIAAGRISDEDLAQTFNDRGKVQFAKGFYDRAIADYDLAIYVKPEFAEAHHNRGVAHEALGDFVQAKKDFEAAKRLGFSRAGKL